MSKTKYEIRGQDFYINGKPTYSELPGGNPKAHGLLMNQRFIQGVFNDVNPAHAHLYDRFGKKWDPDQNTHDLCAALPEWYNVGLRAFTIGLQAGGPIYSFTDWSELQTAAFSPDGKKMNPDTWRRAVEIIKAADELGMIVILSFFYAGQMQYFNDDAAVIEASKVVCEALKELDYDNIIIEIANEYDILNYYNNPETALNKHQNMAAWIRKVKEWTDGRWAVGSSNGLKYDRRVVEASDVVLLHGNTKRQQELHDMFRTVRRWAPNKPIVVNEDSPLFTQLEVAVEDHCSWGYYNTMTKQEPPCDWGITEGEDKYYAYRMAKLLGIPMPELPEDDVYLQGFEENMTIDDGRYIRVASKNPELIDRVYFSEDGRQLDVAFAEPFFLENRMTWIQEPYYPSEGAKSFTARVVFYDGHEKLLTQDLTQLPKVNASKAHTPSPFNGNL